jgi:hypothetical protein
MTKPGNDPWHGEQVEVVVDTNLDLGDAPATNESGTLPDVELKMPEATTCTIRARSNVNLRQGPGTNYNVAGTLGGGQEAEVQAQAAASDGYTWWQLVDGSWVRSDLAEEITDCSGMPGESTQAHGGELLTGGIGLSTGAELNPGEMQVEYYCHNMGYTITHDDDYWYCVNDSGTIMRTLTQQDFDTICQETYSRLDAFAAQDGDNPVPAYRWLCYTP